MSKSIFYGVCEWAFPIQGPYCCKVASELGFDGVELDLGPYERCFPLSNPTIQKAYLEAGQEWGIRFSAIAVNTLCTYGMTSCEGSNKREIAFTAIKKAVQAARDLGVKLVQLPSFEDGYINTEEEFKLTVGCIKYACQIAYDEGILIGTENVLSVEENYRMLHEINMPNLKIYFDTQNPYLRKGFYVPDMIRKFNKLICEVHVKDGKDGELSAALLGKGSTDYYKSMKALKEIGYKGWVHLENFYDQKPMNSGDMDPFELIREDLKILKDSIF